MDLVIAKRKIVTIIDFKKINYINFFTIRMVFQEKETFIKETKTYKNVKKS